MINQVNKEWTCLDEKMMAYCQEERKLKDKFDGLEFVCVLRGCNEAVDELASSRTVVPPGVFLQELQEPTIQKKQVKTTTTLEGAWSIVNGKPRVNGGNGGRLSLENTAHKLPGQQSIARRQTQDREAQKKSVILPAS